MAKPTPTELAATTYWFSCATLRAPKSGPADKAMALDTIHQLASWGSTRVREIAAKRLRPTMVAIEDGGDDATV